MIAMSRQTSTALARIAAVRSNGVAAVAVGFWRKRRGGMYGRNGVADKHGFGTR